MVAAHSAELADAANAAGVDLYYEAAVAAAKAAGRVNTPSAMHSPPKNSIAPAR